MKKLLFLTLGITSIATASTYTIADTQTTSQETQNPFYTWTTETVSISNRDEGCTYIYEIRTKYFFGKPVYIEKKLIDKRCDGGNDGGNV